MWYGSSIAVAQQFETISRNLKFLRLIPNPYPFYDWIMGFHERWSNRAALRGPMLERTTNVVEAGVGTGYFSAQLVKSAKNATTISAIDLSPQMISAAKNYLLKKNLLSSSLFFVRSDCKNLPYRDETFDLYVSSYLFDLLNDKEIESTVMEMERVLAPDGHAILMTMTTELADVQGPVRFLCRVTNEVLVEEAVGSRAGAGAAVKDDGPGVVGQHGGREEVGQVDAQGPWRSLGRWCRKDRR